MAKNLAVKIEEKAERIIKKGHPWVFSDRIVKLNKEGETGDLAILFDQHKNQVFAIGLYDAESPIRIKIIHHNGPAKINSDFFKQKIKKAYNKRKPLLKTNTNAYRLLFGENDGMPGMIVDIYNDVGVLKLYSGIWFPYLDEIIPHLIEIAHLESLVLRMSRNLQKSEANYQEGEVLWGDLKESKIQFTEHGVHFKTDVLLGHKTGFFLDHRANRKRVGELAKNKSVLDVFSYAGGFSVHALVGSAKSVSSLDFSEQALELAKRNVSLNKVSGKHEILSGDAFQILKDLILQQKRFDLIIIDPPSFAKSKAEIAIAKKKYAELAELAIQLIRKNGILLLASCSSRITEDEFFEIHEEVFDQAGVHYEVLETTAHDIDHPIGFKEGAYLKSAYYKIY